MKFILKIFIGIGMLILIPFLLLFGLFDDDGKETNDNQAGVSVSGLPEDVMRWEPFVSKFAKEENISDYVPYILAIIMVESGGKGGDPMQSSESAGQGAGTIQDPIASLKQGVSFYASLVRKGQGLKVDIEGINQSYNFGGSYIDYVSKNGSKSNIELAEKYSLTVVAPSLGNSAGTRYPYKNATSQKFNKPYLYLNGGNFFYPYLLSQFLVENGTAVGGQNGFIIPVDAPIVSSGFVDRINPVTGVPERHKGIDFAQPAGSSIKASKAGEVVIAQFDGQPVSGYGICTIIRHDDGTFALYAHQSEQMVTVGDKVKQGQVIGKVGSTGQSTGPHLHFEIRKSLNGDQVDPAPILGV
ncbi:lysozyme family protein [Carnobacterium divergens]|uniref:lysozyme family protein n=1 Tax=Carnobacterium divergens TaxID=2748 RepID=UPI0039B0A798